MDASSLLLLHMDGGQDRQVHCRALCTNLSEPLTITTTGGYVATVSISHENNTGATPTAGVTACTTDVRDSYSAYTGQQVGPLEESTNC